VVVIAVAAAVMAWLALSADAAVREIAVLPAQVPGDGPARLADAIVARAGGTTSLKARAGILAHPSEAPIEAGRRLQADTVLLTNVHRSGGAWRVQVQLTRTRDAHSLWSWVFEVPADTPDVQSAMAARIVDGLGRQFGVATGAPAARTPNPAALTLTVRGREAWRMRTPPSVQQAITLFEQAIDIDPAFAPAYAGLADCYNLTMSGLPVQVRAVNAKLNAERALALDPGLAEAHTSLAFSLYKFDWKWSEAEAEFRRAIAADPSYALAHHWYGEMLGVIGRFDEAIAELRQARALDPNSLPILMDLAGPLLHSGRTAEARAVVEAGAAINPMFHAVAGRMAEVLAAEGRERESLEEEWRALILRGASLESVEELRAAYRTGGLPAVLRIEIARLEAPATSRFALPAQATFLASKYARLRDRAKTLQWIGTAIDRREDIALHIPTYPEYHWLRDDPEFKRQLARLGLPGK
jgi:tetratricopeptide (TPR) repeat protein